MSGLQTPDVVRAAAAGLGVVVLEDLAHDLAGLRWFGVGDVDGEVVAAGDLVQQPKDTHLARHDAGGIEAFAAKTLQVASWSLHCHLVNSNA